MCSARRNPLKITGKTPKMHWKCPKTLPRIAMPNFDLFASTTLYLLPLHSTLNHILCCFSCMSIAKINFFRNSCGISARCKPQEFGTTDCGLFLRLQLPVVPRFPLPCAMTTTM